MDFVDVVDKAMERRGVTAYTLAKATGIDAATLSRFLGRKTKIRSDLLERIFVFLEIEAKAVPEK